MVYLCPEALSSSEDNHQGRTVDILREQLFVNLVLQNLLTMSKGSSLAPLGLFLTTLMYFVQAFVLCSMVDFTGNIMYWIGIAVYVIIFLVALLVHTAYLNGHAKSDKDDKKVWMIWCLYMVIFSISVGLIFFKGAVKLKQSDWFGPNLLKSVLCITPGLLVLLPQLVFSRSFGQVLLTVSISAALNIFDGIEMLEIILMQHERKDFKLNDTAEYLYTFSYV